MKNMNVKGKNVSKANVRIDVVVTWTSSVGSMQTLTNDWQAINNIVVVVIDSALPSLYCANLYSLSLYTHRSCDIVPLYVHIFSCWDVSVRWSWVALQLPKSEQRMCLVTTYLKSYR